MVLRVSDSGPLCDRLWPLTLPSVSLTLPSVSLTLPPVLLTLPPVLLTLPSVLLTLPSVSQEQRLHQLEEKARMLQASKDELESHYSQQSSLINDLQSKNANYTLETETLKRQISELNQVREPE